MDNLRYTYKFGTNQLDHVKDAVSANNYSIDIDNQDTLNYTYDQIGNLKKDKAEGIDTIIWTVYGKIAKIVKSNGIIINYTYDAAGNRISKVVNAKMGGKKVTWYVRDASGNVMSVYSKNDSINNGHLMQSEVHLYGSSRLGIWESDRDMQDTAILLQNGMIVHVSGKKLYELTNHLGNVLVTVSDRKIPISYNGTTIDHFEAFVMNAQDFYPFGMNMVGREYVKSGYRFGFNGKERDGDITKGGHNYGARIYDTKSGRWLSVDPLQQKYAALSPFNYCANSPIGAKDPDGRIIIFINGLWGMPTKASNGGSVGYWGEKWVKAAQIYIGDNKQPLYYDGALGGTSQIFDRYNSNINMQSRINAGRAAGYKDAASIISKLDNGETIKIITNSMGAAFERGFTTGLFNYISDRSAEINVELLSLSAQRNALEKQINDKSRLNGGPFANKSDAEKQLEGINSKMGQLKSEQEKLENVTVEMNIDLSAHQVDKADPNAKNSYYMTVPKSKMVFAERVAIDQKDKIDGAKFLGEMDAHSSKGANPAKFPSSKRRK